MAITLWFHPIGTDNDGNGGPPPRSESNDWVSSRAEGEDDGYGLGGAFMDAFNAFPRWVQDHVRARVVGAGYGPDDVRLFITDTTGMGNGFYLGIEEYDEMEGL